jgi:hypothetical protein
MADGHHNAAHATVAEPTHKNLEYGHAANWHERLRKIGRIRGKAGSAATDEDDGVDSVFRVRH